MEGLRIFDMALLCPLLIVVGHNANVFKMLATEIITPKCARMPRIILQTAGDAS